MGADEGLPDVGDDRGHDHDGDRAARCHAHGEQAHGHGRQSEADHALDESGDQEDGGDENEERVDHICTLTEAAPGHNLEVTESAFVHDEG
ncbi:hypothetical protein ACVWZZ_003051 [Bradyrhizobium sp. LM6.10]